MSSCPLCGYGISTFAISLDAEFVMCGNENCTYPFEEDAKVVRASVVDKRSPDAIASARKRKAQLLVSSDIKAAAKKSKPDSQRKPSPPTVKSAGPSSTFVKPLVKPTSTAPPTSPCILTAVPPVHVRVPSTATRMSTTSAEQLVLPDLLPAGAGLVPASGSSAIPATSHANATTLNDFLSSIPDFDNVVNPAATSSAPPNSLGASTIRTLAKPAKLSTSSTANFATPASTPLSSPTELLSTSDLLSVDTAMAPIFAPTSTPAATPPDTTCHSDAQVLSDFLSSIPDFDTTITTTLANLPSKDMSNMDEFHGLSLDFLDAEPWTPPVTPPNQPLPIDTLSSKQNPDMSTANLESLLFGNDFEIAFDQEFSEELQAALQS
ncbi:hypothetical protein BGZ96_010499 [Linnemannia gamsii]|uniref:Uncharacterized protein n=1 Tax=Linnemannia gamsii TaxID=64522 RepID=A0ABQ7KEF3_9FUNG|nr:hypothetical protein BGZ96_010499 [Linnemannia gamsii]